MHRSRAVFLGLIVLAASVPSSASAQATHAFSVQDLIAMDRISDPQLALDGSRVVFTVSSLDREANRRRADLWIVGIDGRDVQRLTTHEAADFNPRWSADGRAVYFLSTRSGSSQVWRLRLEDRRVEQVSDLPLDVGNLILSPDGRHIAFSLEVYPDCPTIGCTTTRLDEQGERKASGVLYERIFIRHWDTWKDGRRSHVFVMPASGGEPVDVMKGMDADCPSKPFGGAEEFTFTPDGRSLVFTARVAGRQEPWSTDFDLYVVPIDGSGAPGLITIDNRAWDTGPVFSPDGRTLAYLAMARPGYESDQFRIMLKPWPDGDARVLARDWDRSAGSIAWSRDGKTILATAGNLGNVSLFAIEVANGAVHTVIREGHVRSPACAGDRIVFAMDHLRSPVELYTTDPYGREMRAITRINYERLAQVRMGEPEQFSFAGWNGETVYAWVVKPVEFDRSSGYPVAFLIHGGPQGSFGNDFHYRWNPQIYAAAGYAAVMVDFHGSTGYGQAFSDAINDD